MADNELIVSNGPSGSLHETPMAICLGETFGLDPKQVINVLKNQLIKVPSGKPPATPAELVVVMSALNKYGLDPMMRQLYAWRDNRGDLAVMLSLDGWVELARRQPGYVKVCYEYGPDVPKSGKHKACWEWIKATVVDSVRGDMELPPLYLDEWRKDYGQWLEMPRHKMHVIAYRMAIREAYGISLDVRDPDDVRDEIRRGEYKMAEKVETMAAAMPEVLPMSTAPLVEGETPTIDALSRPVEWVERTPEVEAALAAPAPAPVGFDALEDCPCGIKGCPSPATKACGLCGQYVCDGHMDADGFICCEHKDGD